MTAKLTSGLALTLLLAAFWALAVSVSSRMGATADERLQLVGGYTYWKLHDYRLQPENGNLTMRVQALPLLAMNLRFPPIETEGLRHADRGNEIAHEFVFGLGNPFDAMLQRARAMTALFSLVTLVLVWRWATRLFGSLAGWLSVGIGMLCPTLLAHSGLATSDAAITACLLAAVTACWLLLHRFTWWRWLGASVAVAAALLAKYSAVMLVPIAAILLVLRWAHPAPYVIAVRGRTRWRRGRAAVIANTIAATLCTAAAAFVLVWSAYGFRYSAINANLRTADRDAGLNWAYQQRLLGPPSASSAARVIEWACEHRVLPEGWLYGFTDSFTGSRSRPAFLMGEVSTHGWPKFFPVAFLLKTPPPVLLLLMAGVAGLVTAAVSRRTQRAHWPRRGWAYRGAPLAVLFLLYWAIAINTPLNIGHRHLLPIYPIVYIVAGAAAGWLALTARRRIVALFLAGTLSVQAIGSWAARPFYLSYFTPAVGGSERGWHYLADSSLDWGQGLPDLARWIQAKEARGDHAPIFLTYFGTDSPEARGLPVTRFGDLVRDLEPRTFPAHIRGGWFVISATHYQRFYLGIAGPWNGWRETVYQGLLRKLRDAPPDVASLPAAERQPWADAARTFETLQFGRLCHFLDDRPPLDFIGGSLLLFRLSDGDVQRALYGPLDRQIVNPR